MKYILALVVMAFSIAGCNAIPEKTEVANVCKDPRPQICTMIYMPVCGLDDKSNLNTYASGCNACSRSDVVGYNEGACEDLVVDK